jgi:ABC-type Fe3+-siderophore transport system, permease component
MKMTKNEKKNMEQNIDQAKLNYMNKRSRKILFILFLSIALVMTAVISITMGASSVDFQTVLQVIGDVFVRNDAITDIQRDIVFKIRMPRIITAILVGMALSNAGLLMQGIFQNPLVSPYTLGVSNGAAFGASLAIIFGASFSFLNFGEFLIPVFAFGFAVLTMLMVYGVAKAASDSSSTLILAGVAIGYLFSALVSLVKYLSDVKDLPELVFWMMGSLSGVPTAGIIIMLVAIIMTMILMMWFAWDLNIMSAGEETAISLGVDYKKIKMMSFGISTLLTAVAVAFTGVIGFIGLVTPHVTKMLIGNDFRYSVPGSALVGALLLLTADTIGRNIIAPTQLPVGIVTSMIGVPFFLYLIVRKRGK